ncbi:LapA family protein [Balneatrix alpica]|uniref:LapA family protein n=1 Tax=Balneatrix alpica TaxID=75684 RepID=UPI0027395204|nr:LapA family protein [Balneatrix alpica]
MRLIKRLIMGALALAVLFIGIMFAIHNTQPLALDLVVFKLPELSASLWLMISFFSGGLLGIALSIFMLLQMKARLLTLRRQLNQSNTELSKLRTSVIKQDS